MASITHPDGDSLKILMVAPTSFFKDYGGHIRILEEATALQSLGHQVIIVTYNMGDDMPGLAISRTWPLPYRADYEVGSSRHKAVFDLYLLFRTLQVGLTFQPDIVHGHMHEGALIGGFLARILRAPLVFDFQGSLTGEMVDHGFLNIESRQYGFFRGLERFICRMPDAILTSSLRARGLLEDDFGVRSDLIHPLPDCVDTERFNPDHYSSEEKTGIRHKFGIPEGWPVIAYLGLLADYQGTPDIIGAAAALKDNDVPAFFLIMGFPKVDHYRQLAKRLGVADRVLFTGRVQYRDAARFLSAGDIAVSAKISNSEGSGKVLNYMAMSLPVVATDTVVHREYLAEHGLYSPAGDPLAMAKAISSLIADPQKARSRGGQLRLRAVEKYSWRDAARQIEKVYRRLT